MTHLFGPVPSRRLGRSLGIDVIPPKTCTLDCVYCESGRTTHLTVRRREFTPPEVVVRRLEKFLRGSSHGVDVLTFSSAGEPTLYEPLGELVTAIKKQFPEFPLVVLTNGTLLWDRQVRRALQGADIVAPSLDAGVEETFNEVNRPHPQIEYDLYLEGMLAFREEYKGKLHLEVLLVEGMNDSEADVRAIRRQVDLIRPDRVELNTVVRPPASRDIRGLGRERMELIRRAFPSEITSVIGAFEAPARTEEQEAALDRRVVELVRRRPCAAGEMAVSLGADPDRLRMVLKGLIHKGALEKYTFDGREFYRAAGRGGVADLETRGRAGCRRKPGCSTAGGFSEGGGGDEIRHDHDRREPFC